MAGFQYRALNGDGAISAGTVEAGGRQEAAREIEALGLRPIEIKEAETSSGKGLSGGIKGLLAAKKVSFAQLESFTRLLSSLLSAGVPLSRALTILFRETGAPVAKKKWREVHDKVIDGVSLAEAMRRHPETFPKVYVAMVEAGETGGFLDLVLGQIADFQSRDKELRAKVVAALIYPVVLFFLATAALLFLLVFFIPRFKTLFDDLGGQLPLLTRIIVGISEFFQSYGLIVAVAAVIGAYFGRQWLQSDEGRRKWEVWTFRAPIVGPLSAKFAMARFCRMLGTLLDSGVTLVQSLNVAGRSIGNQVIVDAVSASVERVKKGDSLARSLADCKELFHGSTVEMISVAEESGRLDKELLRLAEVAERDLDQQLKTAVALMEPLMLFFIAGFIGTIFVGMIIPIFSIQDYIN